jgi:hypothetical protein
MDEIKITAAMIAAGVDALALPGDMSAETMAAAETMVEIIFHAMMRVACEEAARGRASECAPVASGSASWLQMDTPNPPARAPA